MRDASRSRVDPRAGWTNGKRRPCRECGAEPPAGRRTFCSDACVRAWKIRTRPQYAAQLVLERDGGVCAFCRVDCVRLLVELRELERACGPECRNYSVRWDRRHQACAFTIRCDQAGVSARRRLDLSRRLWEMDHAVPVVEGGGSCTLDNLRTLCVRCHAQVTRELRARLAAKRRAEREAAG